VPLDVHIVTHTHWDREWYHPYERFRQRLVALVDELLDDPPAAGESFLLDGQAIILEDYLAVRPERRDELSRLLAANRLEAGPWFVLADELIPSGEALVRNLLAGARVLRRLGAAPPPVLYCPDSFGHPAALPTIARGFGLPLIILWRGYGSRRWPAGDTVRWASPAGDVATVWHLPPNGYEFGSHLPSSEVAARARWTEMRAVLASRATSDVVLLTHGADHHARQFDHAAALDALRAVARPDDAHPSSLRAFAEHLLVSVTGRELPVVRGELRDSYGYTWTLQGTLGSRAAQKRMNARAQRLLERDAEPWSALAWRKGARARRPLVQAAWNTLLTAHPHDTLCGCSIDAVADAMELRVNAAAEQAAGIRDDAILDLIGHDAATARTRSDRWKPIVVVRNAAARERTGVAHIDVREFVAHAPVGPGSAATASPTPPANRRKARVPAFGRLQLLARGATNDRIESPRHYPDNDLVWVTDALAWVHAVPGYGLVAAPIGRRRESGGGPTHPVVVDAHSMRNGLLGVSVDDAGRVAVEQVGTGRRIDDLLALQDDVDVGDLYTPAARGPAGVPQFVGARRLHRGPLRGELALKWRLVGDEWRRRRRAGGELTIRLALDADAPFLRIVVEGVNHAENHRLRLAVRTDVSSPAVWADAAFGPVRREPLTVPAPDSAMEHVVATAPLHRYVSLHDDTRGATIYSDGLAEHEVSADGTVLVTLVRAVGALSHASLAERPGHAGWPAATPRAQSIGPYEAAFGVLLHGPRTPATIDVIERTADDVLLPLTGTTVRAALSVPHPVHGATLEGTALAVSALKESENGQWLVARCVNLSDEPQHGRWRFGSRIFEAAVARLDETPVDPIDVGDHEVAFEVGPRGVMTILVR
jgi:alpha-mannosidase